MLDRSYIGKQLPPITMDVDAGRLRFFARAIGETNPIYLDEHAARAAGYRALPAPPTFAFSVELEDPHTMAHLEAMGADQRRILHGEQSFTYFEPICAGDRLTASPRISDIYAKKGGALEFIVKDVELSNQHGRKVAELRSVIVVRNPEPGK